MSLRNGRSLAIAGQQRFFMTVVSERHLDFDQFLRLETARNEVFNDDKLLAAKNFLIS